MKRRSPGIIIFGILYILIGLFFLLTAPLFSILYLIIGIGILMLENLARLLAMFTAILGIISATVSTIDLLRKYPANLLIILLILAYFFFSCVIYFFTRPKVEEQFK